MRQHGYRIDKVSVRQQLAPRAEPYWASLGPARAIGFRRSAVREGTWYARWTEPVPVDPATRPKYRQQSIGSEHGMGYGDAVVKAQAYFEKCASDWATEEGGGPTVEMETVADACRAHVENLRALKGDQAANDADGMYRPVYIHRIAKVRLRVLSTRDIRDWRNQLVTEARPKKRARGRRGANRLFRQLAAALAYAKVCRAISSDEAWKQVGQFPVKDGRRSSYLSVVQRRAILTACEREKTSQELAEDRAAGRKELLYCTKDLADLLRGYFYTGGRPGELAKARVRDLSVRETKITLTSAKNKKGEARPRDFYLYEPEALEFFKRMAEGKAPDAHLITKADGSPWVNEKGKPSYVRWGRGIRAAVREANRTLGPEDQIPEGTVAYTVRHAVITDLLSEDGVDPAAVEEITGTSYEMIKRNYYKVVRERLKEKLSRRQSF
jgi:integrase